MISNRQLNHLTLGEIIKRSMDAKAFEEDKRSETCIRFQRTMRRLMVLRSFSKLVGGEFDVDQLDIAALTRRHLAATVQKRIGDHSAKREGELISKQNYITMMLDIIRFDVFFQEQDLTDIMHLGR